MNIIFQGQYECLCKYGDTGHLSFCFLQYLLRLFRVVPVSLLFFPPFLDKGGNSLLDAQTPKYGGNHWFNKMLNSLSWSLYGKLNGRYADFECCLEQLGEVSVVKFLCLQYHIISKWCILSEATEVVILAGTSIVLRHTHTVSPHLIAACTTGVACCQQLQTDRISECWCLVVSSRNLFQMELDKLNGIEISWTWRLAFLRCQIQLVLQKPFRCLILCRSKT